MTVFAEDAAIKKALVKVYSSYQFFDYTSPWQFSQNDNSTATGFIIEGNRIITNAHAVLNSRFLQIRKDGDAKKYKAVLFRDFFIEIWAITSNSGKINSLWISFRWRQIKYDTGNCFKNGT